MCERQRGRRAAAIILFAALISATLAAVPGTAGDFGRPDPHGRLPLFAAAPADPLETDEEREMRARLWRFMQVPADHGRVVTLTSAGPGGAADPEAIRRGYYQWLAATPFASARGRFNRLADDAAADLAALPGAFAAICAVQQIDRQRAIAARMLTGIEAGVTARVAARLAANAAETSRFAMVLALRADAYAYALDHLLATTPHADAIAIDGLLADLDHHAGQAARGAFCAPVPVAETGPASRYGPRPQSGTGPSQVPPRPPESGSDEPVELLPAPAF